MDTVQRVCRFNNILVCFANHVHILHKITFLCLLCTDRDDEPTSALTNLQFIKGSWILLIIELYFPSRIFLFLAVINSQAHCTAHVHTTPFKIKRNEKVVTLEEICIRVQQYTSSWLSLFTLSRPQYESWDMLILFWLAFVVKISMESEIEWPISCQQFVHKNKTKTHYRTRST
jgi:hypothetical protein